MSAAVQDAVIARGLELPQPTEVRDKFSALGFSLGITLTMTSMSFDRGALRCSGIGNQAARDATEDELIQLITNGRVEKSFISTRPCRQMVNFITDGTKWVILIIRPMA